MKNRQVFLILLLGYLSMPSHVFAGELTLLELAVNGNNYIKHKNPDSLAVDTTYTWPSAAPASNMLLQSDSTGQLSWVSATGTGDFLSNGSVAMTGVLKVIDGSDAAPSIAFNNNQTTGFYNISGTGLGVTVGGSRALRILGASNAYVTGGKLRMATGTASSPSFGFENDGALGMFGGSGSYLGWSTSGTEKMRLTSAGYLGIGLTSPAYLLDVDGDTNIAAASALRFGGTSVCTSAGCTSASDRNLKKNIKNLEGSLDKILQLQAVEYDYKDQKKFTGAHQIGVIAQDVESVFPEVVTLDPKTGYRSVAYDHLVAPLIESVKALYSRLVSLEESDSEKDREILQLKRENLEMKQRIEEIERRLNLN